MRQIIFIYLVIGFCALNFNSVQAQCDPQTSLTCVSMYNHALGADCMDTLQLASLIDTSSLGDCNSSDLTLSIEQRALPVVTAADVGSVLEYEIAFNAPNGNSCSGQIAVVDNLAPQLICENDTIPFGGTPDTIAVADSCFDGVVIDTISQDFIDTLSCGSPYLAAIRTRIRGRDASGNLSDTCERVTFILKPEIDSIDFPDSFSQATNNALSCSDYPNSVPGPEVTGEPSVNGIPISQLPAEYNLTVEINSGRLGDEVVSNTDCKRIVRRYWRIQEWVCSVPTTVGVYTQLIEVRDTSAPNLTCPSIENVTTNSYPCLASVTLPYPTVSDDCNGVDRVDIIASMNMFQDIDANGADVTLSPGMQTITYRAYDHCMNMAECSFEINVADSNPPVAICYNRQVGLSSSGPTRIYAAAFNDGSYDDCELDRFEVARMHPACGYGTDFGEFIEVSCCDLGSPIMVVFRVYDASGNFNECMAELTVQDKSPAQIVAPSDLSVSCEYPIDLNNLTEFGVIVQTDNINAIGNPILEPNVDSIILTDPGVDPVGPSFYGFDGVAFDNCNLEVNDSVVVENLDCNRRIIRRIFTVSTNGIVQGQDVQTITVFNVSGFDLSNITWPLDTTIENGCMGPNIHPDNLGDRHGNPQITAEACSDIFVNFEDQIFYSNQNNDNVCRKILRTWEVTDWCTRDPITGAPIIYTHHQTIKLLNSSAPTFTSDCDTQRICSTSDTCGPGFIALNQSAIDDCTDANDLSWRYRIDLFNDGTFDINRTGNTASGTYPIGQHRIFWTVSDGCNNQSTCSQIFEIESCKLPSPIAFSSIVVELTPMDLDGDGDEETAMSRITPQHLDNKSFHACGNDIRLAFSDNPADTIINYDCSDVGFDTVQLWVIDENDRSDFVRVLVAIQDNNEICGVGQGPIFPIAGNLNRSGSLKTPPANIELTGDGHFLVQAEDDGTYTFPAMPAGGTYMVRPSYDENPLEGVSTFDILMIQQHLLGVNEFDKPLLYLAADVNKDDRISGSDMVDIRKVILGISDRFPHAESWRFISDEITFQDNPLGQNLEEYYSIPLLNNAMNIDFHAIKIGDVSGANEIGASNDIDIRSSAKVEFENKDLVSGEITRVPVYLSEGSVSGIQLDLLYSKHRLEILGVLPGELDITEEDYHIEEDRLRISHINHHAITANQPAFFLEIRSNFNTQLQSTISMNQMGLVSEIYTDGVRRPLDLWFRSETELESTFELLQNRPNPVYDFTAIGFKLPEAMKAELVITNAQGQEVYRDQKEGVQGYNQFNVHRNRFGTSGVYFYSVQAGEYQASKKMIIQD